MSANTVYTVDGSGISGSIDEVAEFVRAISRSGAAILTPNRVDRPWNHHIVGFGVGHDDAAFAETGRSMAAYYENGEAFGGRWWESNAPMLSVGAKYYGMPDLTTHS